MVVGSIVAGWLGSAWVCSRFPICVEGVSAGRRIPTDLARGFLGGLALPNFETADSGCLFEFDEQPGVTTREQMRQRVTRRPPDTARS